MDLAGDVEPKFHELVDAADVLTPYATRFRYPNATFAVEPQPAEFDEALRHAQAVYDLVLGLLPPEVRP